MTAASFLLRLLQGRRPGYQTACELWFTTSLQGVLSPHSAEDTWYLTARPGTVHGRS
jgi:hypothetical protein